MTRPDGDQLRHDLIAAMPREWSTQLVRDRLADALVPFVQKYARAYAADQLDTLAEQVRALASGPVPAINDPYDAVVIARARADEQRAAALRDHTGASNPTPQRPYVTDLELAKARALSPDAKAELRARRAARLRDSGGESGADSGALRDHTTRRVLPPRCICPVGNDAIGPHVRGCPLHPEAAR